MRSLPPVSALERGFPTRMLCRLATHESWRKEMHSPATYTHKWWAQRLSSVFRMMLVSAVTDSRSAAEEAYRRGDALNGVTVLDVFAGAGTTVVEAAKLGASAVAYDINPVASLVQRQALQQWDGQRLQAAYAEVEQACRARLDELHVDAYGRPVLHYFWVVVGTCPRCLCDIDLFSSHVFARHAYPQRHPAARAVCPGCSGVVTIDISRARHIDCQDCGQRSPLRGPVSGRVVNCPCGESSSVLAALGPGVPRRRMFAKLVSDEGRRVYLPVDEFDTVLFERSFRLLTRHRRSLVIPDGELSDGVNTVQALRWGYDRWETFFNARQLYCLGLLGACIRDLDESPEREALAVLFSGMLEYHNVFCSFKGEGTGAVRPLFHRHLLKPERVSLETNPWGTGRSSGSFGALFDSRLTRAAAYKVEPTTLVASGDGFERRSGVSQPLNRMLVDDYESLRSTPGSVWLVNGDSSSTALPDASVQLVITDPPFVDKVQYSELADFFNAWLRRMRPHGDYPDRPTTRDEGEVQDDDVVEFERLVAGVWKEGARVLTDDGILAFTFQHQKVEGWAALYRALRSAGLVVTALQPVKAEMSTSLVKTSKTTPTNLDCIVVCRHSGAEPLARTPQKATEIARRRLGQLITAGVEIGVADARSVVFGTVLALMTSKGPAEDASLQHFARVYAQRCEERISHSAS